MSPSAKILAGAVATAALATIFHGPAGYGKAFIDKLGTQANAATGEASGVIATMATEPSLHRGAILSGPVSDPAARATLLASVRAIPGMSWAKWEESAATPTVAAAPETPATVEQVKNCQDDVDAVIKGKTIQFASGTSTLAPESTGLIDALAKALGPCAGTQVQVKGHTDLTGGDAANMTLSEARAASVVAGLTARGVPAERLVPQGFGETQPLAQGMSPQANAKNRRIEFAVQTAG